MKVNLLKAKLCERDVSVEMLSDMIGVDRSSLYRNMKNIEKMSIGRALKIKEALKLTDEEAIKIFLR